MNEMQKQQAILLLNQINMRAIQAFQGAQLVEASALWQKTLQSLRRLVDKAPETFLPILAANLNNLSNCFDKMGKHKVAVNYVREAVDICRSLANQSQDNLASLAFSLNHLSVHQRALGQRKAAIASAEEAVKINRDLVKINPEKSLPDLARSLNTLSTCQRDLGKYEAAYVSIQEAIEKYRIVVVKMQSTQFLSELSFSLINLSNSQRDSGEMYLALTTIQESVEISRHLAERLPGVFLPNLAVSLHNLSNRQYEVGKRELAFITIQEAVKKYRILAKLYPDKFLPQLALGLNNLSNYQSALGQYDAALVNIQEAVKKYRQLNDIDSGAFLPDLARAIVNLSNHQSTLGQYDAALANIQEAVEKYRQLNDIDSGAFLPDLARALNNLSICQNNLRQIEESLDSINESVKLGRKLHNTYPNTFATDLAVSLNNLSGRQFDIGQRETALDVIKESINLYQSNSLIPLDKGIQSYRRCAFIEYHNKNYLEVVVNWKQAIELIEKRRQLSFGIDVISQSIAEHIYIYDDLSNCQLLQLHDDHGALSTIERSKSRLLVDLSLAMDNDTALGKERRNLQTELHVVRKQLDGNAIRSDETKSIEDLREQDKQLTKQLIAINEQIKQDNPDYKAFDSPLEAEQIVQLAQEQRCSLLTFRPTDQGTLIFLALPTGELKSYHNADFSNQMLNEFLLEHWLRPYYETFMQSYFQYQRNEIDEGQFNSYLSEWLKSVYVVTDRLYQELFVPIYADLQAHADAPLVLAPSRGLSILPLHAASYIKANDARHYLLDDFTVQYTPSFTFFQRLCERERQRSKIGEGLLVLDPLKDIHEIGYSQTDYAEQIFPSLREGSTGHLRHEAATGAAFLQCAPEATLLHLTCHGNYDMQYPLDSAFSFADNEKLSIGDLLTKLELPKAWHVTLSACETSLVDLGQPADDHFGLASSFLLAGAPSVWGTLWSVSQGSTSEIIKQAYKYLFTENLSKAQALRKAQLEYKQKQSHPFYWAGLHHVGA